MPSPIVRSESSIKQLETISCEQWFELPSVSDSLPIQLMIEKGTGFSIYFRLYSSKDSWVRQNKKAVKKLECYVSLLLQFSDE